MKYSKAAAVVAGSLVALGAASLVTTAQAAEPAPGGGLPQRGPRSSQNSDPITSLTAGQRLGPVGRVARQAGGVLGRTSQASPGRVLGIAGPTLGGLPVTG